MTNGHRKDSFLKRMFQSRDLMIRQRDEIAFAVPETSGCAFYDFVRRCRVERVHLLSLPAV